MPTTIGDWIWTAGERRPVADFRIPPGDELLLFGRGLFETTRTVAGEPWRWKDRLRRLLSSAEALRIPIAECQLPSADSVRDFVASFELGDLVVRLNVAGGADDSPGPIWMQARSIPPAKPGYRLTVAPTRPSASDPFASHKTMNYGLRHWAHACAVANGGDDALLLDAAGRVLETAHANIFLRFDDGWATPALTGGILPGMGRRRAMELWPGAVQEIEIPARRLDDAKEAFLTNSVRGVLPVLSMDERRFPISDEVRRLAEAFHRAEA